MIRDFNDAASALVSVPYATQNIEAPAVDAGTGSRSVVFVDSCVPDAEMPSNFE